MTNEKPLILLLHPDDCYRALLSFVLRQHELDVREAASTAACNAACQGIRPALLILDWSFCGDKPGEFLAALRKDPLFLDTAALLVGQPPSRDMIRTAGKQGVAAVVVSQGFNIENFINRVRGVLGISPAPAEGPQDVNEIKQATAVIPQIVKITPEDIERRLRKMPQVPVYEFTVNALIQLTGSAETGGGELAEIVLRDPGAAIHLLRRINAPDIRGQREPTCKIADAIRLLGVREFHKLIETMPLIPSDRNAPAPSWASDEWLGGAVANSRIANLLARKTNFADPDDFETIALLSNIGRPVIASLYPDVAAQMAAQTIPQGLRRADVERRMFGVDCAAVGGMFLRSIHLPMWAVECVTHHHVAGSLRPTLTHQVNLSMALLQAADQILAGLQGCCGVHDILEGFPEEFLAAIENTGLDQKELFAECARIVREVRVELAFLRPHACLADINTPPILQSAGYVCPKRQPMDAVKLFATRNVKLLHDIPLSQLQLSAREGLPIVLNLLGVRGDATFSSIMEHLPRDGKSYGLIILGEHARPALVQTLESTGWLCARLPAPTANLRKLLESLANRAGLQAA